MSGAKIDEPPTNRPSHLCLAPIERQSSKDSLPNNNHAETIDHHRNEQFEKQILSNKNNLIVPDSKLIGRLGAEISKLRFNYELAHCLWRCAVNDCQMKFLLDRLIEKRHFVDETHVCSTKSQNHDIESLGRCLSNEEHQLDLLVTIIANMQKYCDETLSNENTKIFKIDEDYNDDGSNNNNQDHYADKDAHFQMSPFIDRMNDFTDDKSDSLINTSNVDSLSSDDTLNSNNFQSNNDADSDEKICFCNRGSFGKMIACDNKDCKIEWFHFKCVNIRKTPTDKWFCPDCSIMNPQ